MLALRAANPGPSHTGALLLISSVSKVMSGGTDCSFLLDKICKCAYKDGFIIQSKWTCGADQREQLAPEKHRCPPTSGSSCRRQDRAAKRLKEGPFDVPEEAARWRLAASRLRSKGVQGKAVGRAEFVALTAVSPKMCQRPPTQTIRLDSSNHLLRLWNRRQNCSLLQGVIFTFSFFPSPFLHRLLWRKDRASTRQRAINCKKKRSDRWTDGFGLLLPLPDHLSADEVWWGAAKEAKGNDLCQSIRAGCSFTSTYKWGPLASTMSEQLDIQCWGA